MTRSHTRLISFVLAAVLLLSLFPQITIPASAAENTDLFTSVDKQIRAFASAIDRSGADDSAAKALAKHGIAGGGRKLIAGAGHALTATLMNSALLQIALTDGCTAAIKNMQQSSPTQTLYAFGSCNWYDTSKSSYALTKYTSDEKIASNRDVLLVSQTNYSGSRNAYDDSLDWMVAATYLELKIEWVKTNAATMDYKVTCKIGDRFDFSTSSNSGFKNLISGFGAALFREFDWETTVTFSLTVPNSCSHDSGMYHWTYDPEQMTFTNDSSDGYMKNNVTRNTYVTESTGKVSYYHELDRPVRLKHDKPWVLEYDAKKLTTVSFAPFDKWGNADPFFYLAGRTYSTIRDNDTVLLSEEIKDEFEIESKSRSVYNYYGVYLKDQFKYSSKVYYTYRLENQVNSDGSNMIYLTIRDRDTGEVILDRTPMNSFYSYGSWDKEGAVSKTTPEDWENKNNWLSGKDLLINYFGNRHSRFTANDFDLRIYENGEQAGNQTTFRSKTTAPTCTKQGYTTYTCSVCAYQYTDEYVAAVGHGFGPWTTEAVASCTGKGLESRTCSKCNTRETKEYPALGHNYSHSVTKPTCTEQGFTTHRCTVCGSNYADAHESALGHDLSAWNVTTAATCTTDGAERRDCGRCDYYETRTIDALGHRYESVVTAPSCTEQGYTTRTCKTCGSSYADTHKNALGHDLSAWNVTTAVTCTSNGAERRDCGRCDYYETRTIDALGHSYESVVTAPTCTEQGYTTHTCKTCGSSYADAHKNALGHDLSTWNVTTAATCTADGAERRDCARCDYSEVRTIGALGHSYESVVTAPTCTEQGYTAHTCKTCGSSYADAHKNALGHDLSAWNVTTAATCTADGAERRDCARCDYSEVRTIGARGHSYGSWYTVDEVTCTEAGSLQRNCDSCEAFETEIVPAAGHSYASQKTMATCTEQGYTLNVCHCGDKYVDGYMAALGHDYQNGTCARCGYMAVAVPVVAGSNQESSGKPRISWEAAEGAVRYEIYRAASRNGRYRRMFTSTNTSYINTAAAAGQRYYYFVRAITADGVYADSRIIQRTCDLARPVLAVGNRGSDGAVTIRWDAVEGSTGYRVYCATSKDGAYTRLTTTSRTEINHTSAAAGVIYYYKVRAICENADASSTYSAVKSRTRDLPAPDVEISIKAGKPFLKWDKVKAAVSYKIYRADSADGSYRLVKTSLSRNYRDSKAKSGRTYYYKVVAVCKNTAGNSARSGAVSVRSR